MLFQPPMYQQNKGEGVFLALYIYVYFFVLSAGFPTSVEGGSSKFDGGLFYYSYLLYL